MTTISSCFEQIKTLAFLDRAEFQDGIKDPHTHETFSFARSIFERGEVQIAPTPEKKREIKLLKAYLETILGKLQSVQDVDTSTIAQNIASIRAHLFDQTKPQVKTHLSKKIFDMYGVDDCVTVSLWNEGHIKITPKGMGEEVELVFSKELQDRVDDASLEMILRETARKGKGIERVTYFDLSSCRHLKENAPALIAKRCPKIFRSCFASDCIVTDYRCHVYAEKLRHTIGVPLNRGLLLHYCPSFDFSPLKVQDHREVTFFFDALFGACDISKVNSVEHLVWILKTAHRFGCTVIQSECIRRFKLIFENTDSNVRWRLPGDEGYEQLARMNILLKELPDVPACREIQNQLQQFAVRKIKQCIPIIHRTHMRYASISVELTKYASVEHHPKIDDFCEKIELVDFFRIELSGSSQKVYPRALEQLLETVRTFMPEDSMALYLQSRLHYAKWLDKEADREKAKEYLTQLPPLYLLDKNLVR